MSVFLRVVDVIFLYFYIWGFLIIMYGNLWIKIFEFNIYNLLILVKIYKRLNCGLRGK